MNEDSFADFAHMSDHGRRQLVLAFPDAAAEVMASPMLSDGQENPWYAWGQVYFPEGAYGPQGPILRCPRCSSHQVSSTCMGFFGTGFVLDINGAFCGACKWSGKAYEANNTPRDKWPKEKQ